jgi:N-acetylglucosaminylphosphatidylinositol deacetylase
MGIFDILMSFVTSLFSKSQGIVLVSTPFQLITAQKAMMKHGTQLVWFRYLYVLFSRYMAINDLKIIPPADD